MMKTTMTALVVALLAMFGAASASATVLLDVDFEGNTVGALPMGTAPWDEHSGAGNQVIQVVNMGGSNQIAGGDISSGSAQDINAAFSSAVTTGTVYLGMDLTITTQGSDDDYFLMFVDSVGQTAGSNRTRVFRNASGSDMNIGMNASGTARAVSYPSDVALNTQVRFVMSLNVDTGEAKIWIDPTSEASTNVTNTDAGAAGMVAGFAIRQDSGDAGWLIDNIIAADTFAEAADLPMLPDITSINPTSGSTSGGTSVTITGTNLSGVTGVEFGTGNAATNVTAVSATEVTCTTPSGSAGMVDVIISDGTNTDTLAGGFTYVVPTPSVTSISPMTGTESGGTSVTITGTDFTGVTSVNFGTGNAATNVTVVSDTEVTATTPSGTGMVDVIVSNGTNEGTLANGFTYTAPVPLITSITPAMGTVSGGTSVTITGTDLTNVTSVTIGGTAATDVTVVSATEVTATTPAGSLGMVDVVVSDGTDSDTLTNGFEYVAATPVIVSISPSMGPDSGGTTVTVTGLDLDTVTSVTFGGTAGTNLTLVSATSLMVDSPAGSGMVDVVVSDGTNMSTLTNGFNYVAALPMITSISPTSGTTAGGTTVTVTGADLNGVTSVTFDGTAGTNLVNVNATTLMVDAPAGTAGQVDVVISDGTNTDTLAGGFTYVTPSSSKSDNSCSVGGSGSMAWLWMSVIALGMALFAAPLRRKA